MENLQYNETYDEGIIPFHSQAHAMYSVPVLAQLLRDAEQAHKASGDSDANWPDWYARWIAPRMVERGIV